MTALKSTVTRTVTVKRTPRFHQVCGKFDLPTDAVSVKTWDVDVTLPDDWHVGVIVGPSMAGKTTLANELFPGALVAQGHWEWPTDKCIADGFPESDPRTGERMSIDDITTLLSSVGFSSPPDWKKPYAALSNGGKFRVDLARTLAERPELAVVDEFGSLVHQQARQVAAAAAAKAVRRRGGKLVALCVHPDAVEYFEPDWIIEIIPGEPVRLAAVRGSVRRPPIEVEICRVRSSAWKIFKPHHYLTDNLHPKAVCFGAYVGGQLVAFDAWLPFFGKLRGGRPARRGHRTVCLPDFQGVGIGRTLFNHDARLWAGLGYRVFSCTAHPAEVRSRLSSGLWRMTRKPSFCSAGGGSKNWIGKHRASTRLTASFEYIGPPMDREEARRLLEC